MDTILMEVAMLGLYAGLFVGCYVGLSRAVVAMMSLPKGSVLPGPVRWTIAIISLSAPGVIVMVLHQLLLAAAA